MEELARKAAEALEELGSCGESNWQERKEALLRAGECCGSGFGEVLSWFGYETE